MPLVFEAVFLTAVISLIESIGVERVKGKRWVVGAGGEP